MRAWVCVVSGVCMGVCLFVCVCVCGCVCGRRLGHVYLHRAKARESKPTQQSHDMLGEVGDTIGAAAGDVIPVFHTEMPAFPVLSLSDVGP